MVNYKKALAKKQRAVKAEINDRLKQMLHLRYQPMDTWFFRESRPHDAVGASELCSLFPPSVRTLMGALRSFIGEQFGVNWQRFNEGDGYAHNLDLDLIAVIGNGENLGGLSVQGPWVSLNGQRLYPAPTYLFCKDDDFTRLQIGDAVECDLGNVRLPMLPTAKVGYKVLEQAWVSGRGWQQLLDGKLPAPADVFRLDDLLKFEARLGIARDNLKRNAIDGKLYQTQHLRLNGDVAIELDVHGLHPLVAECIPQQGHALLRLGGEGRMAALALSSLCTLPTLSLDKKAMKKIIIHFITPANFNGKLFPDTITEHYNKSGQVIYWQGEINGVGLIIDAAVIGKVHREGGWDMQKHQPRAVRSYVPAGTAWFCRLRSDVSTADVMAKLHGQCIGLDTEWGRGQLLIGLWHDENN